MTSLPRDNDRNVVLGGVYDDGSGTIAPISINSSNGRVKVTAILASGVGTVTSVSVVTANGISGTVATATTTPAITLALGAITPTSVNGLTLAAQSVGFAIAGGTTSKTLTVPLDATVSGTNTGDQTNISGTAAVATTVTITDNNSSNGNFLPTWSAFSSGNRSINVSSTKLTFNPSTATLTTTTFAGALTGNADTATSAATLTTTRTLWGQNFNGSANVTGSLTSVSNITGGASSMTITAGTGNSRTLTLQTTTSGGTATDALVIDATQKITTGTWNASVIDSTYGGTGVNNAGRTLTLNTNSGTLAYSAASKTLTVAKTLTLDGTDSTTMTFPSTSATIARTDAAQTFTGTQTFSQANLTANAITASGNAATVPITSGRNIVTNNSAATLTITMTTTSAVNMQTCIVQILDASAAAQTITWVNTENSTVTAPTTSNGSTTLPLTVGFIYNSATSKWRCVASA